MWKPSIDFLALHYAWIITLSILSLVIIYPHGNLKAIDAYFFGASAATESGLNTVDVKDLKTYQQVYIYLIPILGNLGFINIIVVVFRVRWFEKHLKAIAPHLLRPETLPEQDAEAQLKHKNNSSSTVDEALNDGIRSQDIDSSDTDKERVESRDKSSRVFQEVKDVKADDAADSNINSGKQIIQFAEDDRSFSDKDQVLYIPPPWRRDRGTSFSEAEQRFADEDDGRNSQFHNLSAKDREILGGIEYRSLKLLLKIVVGYFFGLHLFGAICLVGWILHADPKYRDYLVKCGQSNIWCRPTWILFGILFLMNSIDVILIIVLDLNNPAVNNLAPGPRVLAAIFQAASARHTGTSSFNLADVSPAVQFSLVIMMYIAIFPIAISIRASNVYEERTLGIYDTYRDIDESDGRSYIVSHIQNQLGFDLWYIFLGCFCICTAEAGKIADTSIPAFSVFSVLFEVVSAYGNVGLSLGYPTVSTSLSGEFTVFSKLVICVMMIRGRHRGLPYKLDRAIVLPGERLEDHQGRDDIQTSVD
ncbi:low affinity potassium transporter [Aspergillus hancockii]|nr:low affinity potassium transporter [Aspergillus hancockii]